MNKVELYIKSQTKNIMISRALVTSFMLTIDSSVDELNDIKTIVSEAVTNAIIHGYENQTDKKVRIALSYSNNKVNIEVEDKGIGITDIDKVVEPLYTSKSEDERSGLGFTIIQMYSDFYEVISTPNKGTLIKCYKTIKNAEQKEAA